ncbi:MULTISPECIES: OmpA family protein [Flectobacillus]|uniref:OmpA family protein n=1 Tax=Flectobacillus TaxID=101 RepID=UPI001595BDC4|nr:MULTISPECIES: OmpA family protein [Flectobacillus]MDI9872306.1 OmpA family protein [Flectobacillus roseus]
MILRLLSILLFLIFNHTNLVLGSPLDIKIRGLLIDAITTKSVSANIYWAYSSNSTLIWSNPTFSDGHFDIKLKDKAIKLRIEATGYESVIIDLSLDKSKTANLFLKIPLLKQTTHQLNKIFSQSTTKSDKTKKTTDNKHHKVTNIEFIAVNGLTHEPLAATYKFVPTNFSKSEHYTTSVENPHLALTFNGNDIYAVEIAADNFQTFLGNLIIDNLDSRTHHDTIYLAKELVFLNIITQKVGTLDDIYISKYGSKAPHLFQKLSFSHEIAYETLEKNERYQLYIINDKKDTISHTFQATHNIYQILSDTLSKSINHPNQNYHKSILYFEASDFHLKPESYDHLREAIKRAKYQKELLIDIYAYTDNLGEFYANLYLSEIRAMYIKNTLSAEGISDKRIRCIPMGSKNPISKNKDEASRSQNRRVEIILYNPTISKNSK